MKIAPWLPICFLLAACAGKSTKNVGVEGASLLRYAQGFTIRKQDDCTWLDVTYPYLGATSGYSYVLVPRDKDAPPHDAGTTVIEVPLETIVCTATTHIPHLDYLGLTSKLVGFPTTDYVSSPAMRKRIDAGEVKDLGVDKAMDLEALYALRPSLVMGYVMSAEMGQLRKIRDLGIPVVINSEYLEKEPLGRAEWIKFTAALFGKENEADSVFRMIETEYLETRALADHVQARPTVMSGIVYGDAWFLPGGQNYAARLLKDAGLDYLWAADSSNGFLELSFESVYQKAREADVWIGVGSFGTLEELAAAEKRYALFKPFTRKQVYTYNARMGAKGGNDFLESGYLRPDIILKDLVKIAHPDLMPEHQFYFHKRLD